MLTPRNLLLVAVLIVVVGLSDRSRAQGPPATATLHAIGDLPGGGALTIIRDATRVGSTIYAVGGAVTTLSVPCNPVCPNTDTAILWRSSDGTETPTPLPTIPGTAIAGTSLLHALDITPDGAFIASLARNNPSVPNSNVAVRVTTSNVPFSSANLNLAASPFPALPTQPFGAQAISDDGTIVYAARLIPGSPGIPNASRALRFDTTSSAVTEIPCPTVPCPAGMSNNVVRSSSDGGVAVGLNFTGPSPRRAFRYVHATGVSTQIPLLGPTGDFNTAWAMSPDGDLVLLAGNGGSNPNGEIYLYRGSTGAIQNLGTPMDNLEMAWGPGGRLCLDGGCGGRTLQGGMTADGSVIAFNFSPPPFGDGQYPYIRNQYGWFQLASVLAANGVDLFADGWNPGSFVIHGMSPDGTLVFGAGARNGRIDGFVAEFPINALASFNPQPVPPASTSLVGLWTFDTDNISNPEAVIIFGPDGAYYHMERTGYERGVYTFDGSRLALTTLHDNNGTTGLSDDNGLSHPGSVSGDTIIHEGQIVAYRLIAGAGSIVGGWVFREPVDPLKPLVVAFLPGSSGYKYFLGSDNPEFNVSFNQAEGGTYTWNEDTHELLTTRTMPSPGVPDAGGTATLSPNELQLRLVDPGENFDVTFTRVVDPATPVITSALSATVTTGLPFAYQIAGTNTPSTFGAIGLPLGLNIDTASGVISGAPAQAGTFDVLIEASNNVSTSTGRNHLSLLVIAPVVISGTGPTVVTPIPPDGGEPPPVTIEFTNVTGGGEVSVATIDPETVLSAPDPPAGFALGDNPVYYEITTTATFEGPVTVCFSYAGITFAGFPRLLHYDEGLASWVDITTTVDTTSMTVCGLTSSFSPFLVAESALNGVGFQRPIEPVAGALNTVRAGSTVPLKFNVYGEGGVEITNAANISNLAFRVSRVVCESGAPEEDVPFESTGGTGLRYDTTAGQFVQNWSTPRTPGACYLVKVTGDGLLLSARFKVK